MARLSLIVLVTLFSTNSVAVVLAPAALRARISPTPLLGHRRCAAPLAMAADDPYSILGVKRDASATQIKQAYRRLALRNHPDVAGPDVPDAAERFAKIADAYSTLSDPSQRAKYDRGAGAWRSSGGGSSSARSSSSGGRGTTGSSGWSDSTWGPAGYAASEAQRRWREQNPTPDELGDSFGALLGDLASAVGKVVGGGDWLSMLDELQLTEGAEMNALLRSTDLSLLGEELESARFVQSSLKSRMTRLTSEVQGAVDDLASFKRSGARGKMEVSLERELERDLSRRRERLQNARRLLTQAESREKQIAERIEVVKKGPPPGSRRSGPARSLPSVDDELKALKKAMGK